jgi:hypothetical protein
VPAAGGLFAGLTLLLGKRIARRESSTDYMEAIAIGAGELPVRSSLVKSTAALFSIGSGGSIGREGPMVQLSALMGSLIGRWRKFTTPQLRLLVACGAAAGIASAYNAPIAGSFFVAEIILGSIAMESLGPLVVSAVAAALTVRVLTNAQQLYEVPAFKLTSPWEMLPYIVLGFITGTLAGLLGVGGGIIVVPALMIVFGTSDLIAKGTSLLMMIPTAISGTIGNVRRRNVDLLAAVLVGVAACTTTALGAWIATLVDPLVGNILFAVFLIFIAVQMAVRAVRGRAR